MPGFDGTGPQGTGPNTGRGAGNCRAGIGRGLRRFAGRRFFGRGRRRQGFFSQDNRSEKEMLNDEEKELEEELKAVREEKKNIENNK